MRETAEVSAAVKRVLAIVMGAGGGSVAFHTWDSSFWTAFAVALVVGGIASILLGIFPPRT